ncbi:hypothetical protein GCM10017771_95670 [Streptomyces capitiformicae]|uniref:Uncharacterized protein n=1 Tax=Streptomyces capitiformicae TaxID=2014920 RepID=A0A918ZW95_9ACTN|nr:hypothetical protein GCM10017771_95670 [Streptomyces capitiformicae]
MGAHKGRFQDSSKAQEAATSNPCLWQRCRPLDTPYCSNEHRSASKALFAPSQGNPTCLHTRCTHFAHTSPVPRSQLPFAKRIDDLLPRLSLDEKTGSLLHQFTPAVLHQFTPAVERLGIAAFRTGQETLPGVAWMGQAPVYPQAVDLGTTWNTDLVRWVGEAVSKETRAIVPATTGWA